MFILMILYTDIYEINESHINVTPELNGVKSKTELKSTFLCSFQKYFTSDFQILGYLPGQGTAVNVTCAVKVQSAHCNRERTGTHRQNVTFQKGPPEALGGIQFFPKSFFELKYYPYYGKLRHVSDQPERRCCFWGGPS